MNEIKNVIGIKLLSYSLPEPKFNIEENKNNIFKLKINENVLEIKIPTGKYKIEELIDFINIEIKKEYEDINIYLNNQQKVVIVSEINEISIISTNLSKNNFGFINQYYKCNNIVADKIWDLRINNKVYLYLENLSDTIPFGILYFNGLTTNNPEFKFEEPYNLNSLKINFKDMNNNEYNFYDLPHNLNFIIEYINQ